jgi:AcrR family transcriptional regulator
VGRPSAAAARDTRQVILDAALDLFAERGFHATSMRALATAVGVRESAIYHHFPSKDAILFAVVEPLVRARIEIAERELERLGKRSLVDVLTTLAERLVERMQLPEEKKLMRLVVALGPTYLGEEQSPFLRIRDSIRSSFMRLLDELQRQGKVRKDVDREALMLSFGAPLFMISGAMWGVRPPIPISSSRFIKAHATLIARAIGVAR